MDHESKIRIDELISYWFSDPVKKLWFNSTPEFDEELRKKYLSVLEQAEKGELDHWREEPLGALALIIILDQFPLNMFRRQPRSFATEAQARQLAEYAVSKGFDNQLDAAQKAFLYLPFMHSENLADQDKSVSLFEKAGLTENLKYAIHHRGIVQRFGRFPHRNSVLGRESTTEEIRYLNSKEAFLG